MHGVEEVEYHSVKPSPPPTIPCPCAAPGACATCIAMSKNSASAVQQQLGLKLESQKAMIEVLVVYQVEKPSAN